MSDSFEFTLHSPLTKEDWNKISDAELENAMSVTFQTPQGRRVRYIKSEVLDKIRNEIEEHVKINQHLNTDRARALCWCLDMIDKYKAESEDA